MAAKQNGAETRLHLPLLWNNKSLFTGNKDVDHKNTSDLNCKCEEMGCEASSTVKTCVHCINAVSTINSKPPKENPTWKNILLFCIVCISLAMLIYTSGKVIAEFLDEPIAVETTLKKEIDANKKFPDIVLCSHRMASLKKLKEELKFSNKPEEVAKRILAKVIAGEEVGNDSFAANGIDIEEYNNDILWHSSISYLSVKDLEAVKIAQDEFVIDCQIKDYSKRSEELIDCLPYMEDIITNEFGVCQKISLPAKLRAIVSMFHGATYGLRLNLFLNNKDSAGSVSSTSGIRVTIFDPLYPTIPQNSGVDIAPATSLSLGFSRMEYTRISRRNSNEFECVSKRDWSTVLPSTHSGKLFGAEYASTDMFLCDQTCTSIFTQAACNCSTMHYFGDTICDASSPGGAHSDCINEQTKVLTKQIGDCRQTMCKPSCTKIEYKVSTNQALFPSDSFLPVFLSRILSTDSKVSPYIREKVKTLVQEHGGITNRSTAKMRQEFVHLHIFSQSGDTTHIQEKNIYTQWSLISNIGGNMGMFLGLSLVGFFKFAMKLKHQISSAIRHVITRKKSPKRNHTTSHSST